jgi:hypothetical protein
MPVYILVGPAAALIGIVAIFFVMRRRSTDKKSMYSSRRGQIERKVRAARQRTLAPSGHGGKAPTATEIAAAVPPAAGSVYEAPAALPRQAWETPAAPPPAYMPPPAAPAPAYEPPPAPSFEPAAGSSSPVAPYEAPVAPVAPEWATPAPSEPAWTPSPVPAPAPDFTTPAPSEPMVSAPAPAPVSTPAAGGASWEIVGGAAPQPAPAAATSDKGRKESDQPTGSAWQLATGEPAEGEDDDDEIARKPNAAMALAQYAVLVVGLVMVLIGVLVMVANAKVT